MFINYYRDNYQSLQELRIDAVVNYAVDAAVEEMVNNSANLEMDYADWAYLVIDPEVALDMFTTTFLMNYNMSPSEDNKAAVRTTYLPMFCVAAYDGYYMAEPTKFNSSGAHDAIFSVKQPYLYRENDKVYALNLGLADCKEFNGTVLQKITPPISESTQLGVINSCVSDAIMSTVYENQEQFMLSTFYVPSEMTNIVRTNPIQNVTVMAYVSNVDAGFGKKVDSFGIGGARVTHERFVGAYERDGQKFYTYMTNITNEDLITTFENPQLAAEAGYQFDLKFFSQ